MFLQRFIQSSTYKLCTTENNLNLEKSLLEILEYDEEDNEKILNRLNSFTKEELISSKLPKAAVNKFLTLRSQKGSFTDISELLYIEGVGFKQAKAICSAALNEGKIETIQRKQLPLDTLLSRKRLIRPTFQSEVIF